MWLVSADEVTFAEGEIKQFDVPLSARIFIWDSLYGMTPLAK